MNTFFRILRSIIYVPAFILFFGWIAVGVRAFDPEIGVILPLWTRPPGIAFMIIGGILVLTCVVVFIIRGKGTPAAFDPPTEFVASGPYAYVRNPMYIGGFILLIGFGLCHFSLSILILSVVLIVIFHLFSFFMKNPSLRSNLGKAMLNIKSI